MTPRYVRRAVLEVARGGLLIAVLAGLPRNASNSNALAWQGGLIVPRQDQDNPTVIAEFDQEAKQWVELGTWGDVNFPVPPGGSAVFRFQKNK